jgi:hypothetical protein
VFLARKCRPRTAIHVAGPHSSLDRKRIAFGVLPEKIINVSIRTLDSILVEAGSPTESIFCRLMWRVMKSKCCAVSMLPVGGHADLATGPRR